MIILLISSTQKHVQIQFVFLMLQKNTIKHAALLVQQPMSWVLGTMNISKVALSMLT